jgi:hypothetical protein
MEWASTVLVPQERVTKGVPAGPPSEELGTRILLGGPVSRPQVLPDGPPDAADYTMVDLGVTFNPAKGEQIQGAWVQVLLSVDDGTAPAIAWSMAPERLTAPGTATTEVEVKADFKIVSVGAKTSLSGRQHTYLQALNPLRADPTWEFARTASIEITGAQRMTLIVRSAIGSRVQGSLNMVALIGRKRLRAIPYEILAGDGAAVTFAVR